MSSGDVQQVYQQQSDMMKNQKNVLEDNNNIKVVQEDQQTNEIKRIQESDSKQSDGNKRKTEHEIRNLQSPALLSQQSQNANQNINRLKDFEKIREIGRGAYGTVYKVRNKKDQYLAMKEVSQFKLKKDKKVHQVYMEKIMRHFKFAGIPEFHSCFTQDNQFYFVMAFAEGGQLSRLIKRYHLYFTPEIIRFYVAEMVLILEYIHSLGFSHRDFKPENLVLTKNGHLQLIDFGTLNDYCKKLIPKQALQEVQNKDDYRRQKITGEKIREVRKRQTENGSYEQNYDMKNSNQKVDLLPVDQEEIEIRLRSQTFCGTAEYLSPEMLEDDQCDMNGDLWALGCIIYKMFTNNTPFYDNQEFLIFNKIKQGHFNRNHEQIQQDARDLIAKLLIIDQNERIGSVVVDDSITAEAVHQAYDKIKAHPFFQGIVWETLYQQQAPELIQQIISGQFDIQKKAQKNQMQNMQQNNETFSDDDYDDEDDDEDDFKSRDEDDFVDQKITKKESDSQLKTKMSDQVKNNNQLHLKVDQLNNGNVRKHNSEDLTKSPKERKSNNNCVTYQEILQKLSHPLIEANLFYQVQINKINKKYLIFQTKRARQILLFNIDPITIIYYIPFKKQPTLKRIILDDKTIINLENPQRITFQDQNEKYIFEDPKDDSPSQLYQQIMNLKQQKQN